jgi:hypothetical protein
VLVSVELHPANIEKTARKKSIETFSLSFSVTDRILIDIEAIHMPVKSIR